MRDSVEDMGRFGRMGLFAQSRPYDISRELRLEVTQLREAVGRRDGPRIGAVSHRLRGSVANFQAHTAALAAQQLEETAGRGNLAEVDRMFTEFERATAELMDGLGALKA
jgi:HPt (histidine-containing phosphotransfer) domain-containing protein